MQTVPKLRKSKVHHNYFLVYNTLEPRNPQYDDIWLKYTIDRIIYLVEFNEFLGTFLTVFRPV